MKSYTKIWTTFKSFSNIYCCLRHVK